MRLRSLLFAPAVRADFIAKLPGRDADAVAIDCEDAAPANAKAQARAAAAEHAPALAAAGCATFTRINPPGTEWFADDVAGGLVPELAGVIVPMVETIDGLDLVGAALDTAGLTELAILAGIETGLGVADSRALLDHPRVMAAYFGAEDYIADLGGVRTAANTEVLYARSQVVLAGRLAQVPVLDMVTTDFNNDERFTAEAADARTLGFAGKLCIHPRQVPLANAAFVPSEAEVAAAQRMLAAYDEACVNGLSAIAVDGQMVDEPLAVQARQILALATEGS